MLSTKPLQHVSKSHLVNQVFTAIIQDRPFETSLTPHIKTNNNDVWTTQSVSELLRTIPRCLFVPPRSFGRQKGFRHRSPLKQRKLQEDALNYGKGVYYFGPAACRDPEKVSLGVRKAHEFFDWVESDFGFVHDEQTCKAMAIVLAKGCLLSMKPFWDFFKRMARKGLLSTNSITDIIKVLGEEGLAKEALGVLRLMQRFPGCLPDTCAYNTVIYALCRVGHFLKARFLLQRMELPGFRVPPDKFTYTVLISSYCRYGMETGCKKATRRRIWQANNIFRLMLFNGFSPDVVTYNCLINGCCKTYRIDRALELFEDMRKRGCLPNRVTYDSFIRYFSTVNEVDKAIEMLRRMEKFEHGKASTSSFTPIIHGLCEAGRVEEAWKYLAELVERGSIPRAFTYKLVCDTLKSSGDINLLDRELCEKIQEGIDRRIQQVMKEKVKPLGWDSDEVKPRVQPTDPCSCVEVNGS